MNSTEIKIYQVDAFTKDKFKGNPAAVCLLNEEISEEIMLKIAGEMNLSETAFITYNQDSVHTEGKKSFGLRWFSPVKEMPICGHATLASAKVLYDEIGFNGDVIYFNTKSGELTVKKDNDGFIMDFPLDKTIETKLPENLLKAMNISEYTKVFYGENTKKLVIELKDVESILSVNPDFIAMKNLDMGVYKGIGITCRGKGKYDFITRYFNPWVGVNEDPVTGSVHTLLADYWSGILGKSEMKAYQASVRGGEIYIKVCGGRVELAGDAVLVLKGTLLL